MQQGYVHVYTGNGKGKTTAAIGLAIRSLGAGFAVYLGQFIKGMKYSEIVMLEKLSEELGSSRLEVHQYGRGCFIRREPTEEDKKLAQEGLGQALAAMVSGRFQLVILDEINVALHLGLLHEQEVLSFVEARPQQVELVLTGRYAPQALLDRADLVTEMQEIRHYFRKGVEARKGIER